MLGYLTPLAGPPGMSRAQADARVRVEVLYADELARLREESADKPRPAGWHLSPQAVVSFVLGDERQCRLEQAVRRRVNVTQQIRVAELSRRVLAAISGLQADPVQVSQVTGTVAADDHGCAGSDRYTSRSRA